MTQNSIIKLKVAHLDKFKLEDKIIVNTARCAEEMCWSPVRVKAMGVRGAENPLDKLPPGWHLGST